MNITEIRAKYPQYNSISDEELAGKLHQKFYPQMPFEDFAVRIGLPTEGIKARNEIGAMLPSGSVNPEKTWTETGVDVVKSLGSGVRSGTEYLVGLPADAGQLLASGATYGIDRLLGVSPDQASANLRARRNASDAMDKAGIVPRAPTSQEIQDFTVNAMGDHYQPRTTAGEYGRTVGEFVPGAVMGPGGIIRKTAMATIPALASEAAGQATEGEDIEPYARIAGALAGGVAAAGRGRAGTKQMLKEAPTSAEVSNSVDLAYKAIDNAKVVFDQNAYKSMAMKIQYDLRKRGLLPEQSAAVSPMLKSIMGRTNKLNGWTEIDSIRKQIGQIAASTDPKMAYDAMLASVIRGHIDDLVNHGKVISLSGVPRNQIPPMIKRARELSRREIIARNIGKMTDSSEWYVSGDESGLRNTFSGYGKKHGTNLEKMEKDAFQKVVRREGILNPLTNAGSRLGQIVYTALGATGYVLGDITGVVGSVLGTQAARKFMEIYTKRGVDAAMKTVLAGKSAQQKAALVNAMSKGDARVRGLLSLEAGSRDRRGGGSPPPLLGR